MTSKTERQLDLENLKKMQKAGEIGQDVNLEEIANNLPKWRISDKWYDKLFLADYGQDEDLDILVYDQNVYVRAAVARRGRDCDLDKLVSDPDKHVRYHVAYRGRNKDLRILMGDPDDEVRHMAEEVVREKALEQVHR